MKQEFSISEALERVKDNPELRAVVEDLAIQGADTVVIEFDDEGMQILNITKDSPTVDASHVPTTDWRKKPKPRVFNPISKSTSDEERYTFSPWYVPDSLDAHGEWTDAKEVQHAFWKYLAQDDRDIRLQHNTDIVAGQWVEGATWPYEVSVPVKHPDGDTEYTFPAGTPFLGIIWQPWAWELIKAGEIRGLSIGGNANRAEVEFSKEDYDPTGKVSFTKMIRHENGKYELYSHDGSKHLGSFDTEEDAKKREAEINRIKHIQKSVKFIIPKDFVDGFNLAKHAQYISEPTKEGLASELTDVLADIVAFNFLAWGFHWNVMGINFQQFHDLFEEIYEDALSSIDPTAESIRKLNFDAPVALVDYMGRIAQMEIPETNDPEIMSQILYVANEQLRACLTKAFCIATYINEQGIANFIAERLDMHSKWQWQLRAIVGDSFADSYEINVAEYTGMIDSNIETHVELEKHLQGRHDQSFHAGGGRAAAYRKVAIERKKLMDSGKTNLGMRRDAKGRIINPDATGGYKAKPPIPEVLTYKGVELTPEHSLWHHLESDGQGGYKLTAERQALHDEIIAKATAGIPSQENSTFYMLGGGPASGKSSAIKSGSITVPDKTQAVQINADDVKGELPEFERMRMSDDNSDFFNGASFAHEESSLLAKDIQSKAFSLNQDVVLDGTGDSSINKLTGKINEAKSAGYAVHGIYLTVPTDVAISRSFERSLGSGERRFVPPSIVAATHASVSDTFVDAISKNGLFDKLDLWDSNVPFGSKSNHIGTLNADGSFAVLDDAKWQEFKAKGNQ